MSTFFFDPPRVDTAPRYEAPDRETQNVRYRLFRNFTPGFLVAAEGGGRVALTPAEAAARRLGGDTIVLPDGTPWAPGVHLTWAQLGQLTWSDLVPFAWSEL